MFDLTALARLDAGLKSLDQHKDTPKPQKASK